MLSHRELVAYIGASMSAVHSLLSMIARCSRQLQRLRDERRTGCSSRLPASADVDITRQRIDWIADHAASHAAGLSLTAADHSPSEAITCFFQDLSHTYVEKKCINRTITARQASYSWRSSAQLWGSLQVTRRRLRVSTTQWLSATCFVKYDRLFGSPDMSVCINLPFKLCVWLSVPLESKNQDRWHINLLAHGVAMAGQSVRLICTKWNCETNSRITFYCEWT